MFEKFKIVEWHGGEQPEWGISRRICLFWHRPLIHKKYVFRDKENRLCKGCPSREILTFRREESAEDELDRLYFGGKPITSRNWKNGKCIGVQYG